MMLREEEEREKKIYQVTCLTLLNDKSIKSCDRERGPTGRLIASLTYSYVTII